MGTTLDLHLARSIRLVICDIDGTMVRDDKTLADATVEAVARAQKAGIAVTLISARPASGLGSIVRDLQIAGAVGAFNGGTLFRADGEVIEAHRLAAADAREAVERLDAAGVPVWVFADGLWLARSEDALHGDRERKAACVDPTIVQDFSPWFDRTDKVVGVSDDHPLVERMEREIGATLGRTANVVRSQLYFLDVTAKVANKGDGAAFLAKAHDVPLERTAAVGDMPNDIPMLTRAGLGVAMGQAGEAVRAAAGFVTASNEEDGVARFLDRLVEAQRD
ncbi:Cof-type HAD-IIB family hydrolase [Aureimonas sp. AU22]|jgi:Cof subfamily protein (haloacid dehalogenase superfamily)|uniref:Cof-type HAD-IIB family hydrolase n=1 Tax=Aureimonas sp. AU22 TaxID=1638162 RepID=UPI000783CC83|nr:Cof-type HAD-IIB family hydrolase [Aureimonas sp. AU22]